MRTLGELESVQDGGLQQAPGGATDRRRMPGYKVRDAQRDRSEAREGDATLLHAARGGQTEVGRVAGQRTRHGRMGATRSEPRAHRSGAAE